MAILAKRTGLKGEPRFSIQMRQELRDKLEEIALSKRTSLSGIINEMLEEALAAKENAETSI